MRWSRTSPLVKVLAIFGPGLIAANAGNDAGGIATFSASGASYGYNLLWALALSGVFLAIALEMGARMGAVTGRGLADLIREQFGVRWTALAMLVLLIANTGLTVSEFLGVLAGVQVLAGDTHTPLVYLLVPTAGLLLWLLVLRPCFGMRGGNAAWPKSKIEEVLFGFTCYTSGGAFRLPFNRQGEHHEVSAHIWWHHQQQHSQRSG